jgi:peptidoglycan biosynthesis protein MviN/MurJ (putative lipid II flippase)
MVPSWSNAQLELVTSLSRLLLVAQAIFPIGIIAGSLGSVYGKVRNVALAGTLYNLGIVLGVIFLYQYFGLYGIVLGVILGSIMHSLVQIYPSDVRSILKEVRVSFDYSAWWMFLKENSGRAVSVVVWQVFIVFLSVVAALYGDAQVSVFNLAYRMDVSLIAVLGVSISSVLMPQFARAHEDGDETLLARNLTTSVQITLYSSIVTSALILLLLPVLAYLIVLVMKTSSSNALAITYLFSIFAISLPLQNYFEITNCFSN